MDRRDFLKSAMAFASFVAMPEISSDSNVINASIYVNELIVGNVDGTRRSKTDYAKIGSILNLNKLNFTAEKVKVSDIYISRFTTGNGFTILIDEYIDGDLYVTSHRNIYMKSFSNKIQNKDNTIFENVSLEQKQFYKPSGFKIMPQENSEKILVSIPNTRISFKTPL